MSSTVSILTVSINQNPKLLHLLHQQIKEQTYKNIIEWIIITDNIIHIEEDNIKIKQYNKSITNTDDLYQWAFKSSRGDIMVHMDTNDFQFPSRVKHSVDTLTKSNYFIAGCTNIFIYNYLLNKTFQLQSNTVLPNYLAYKKEYDNTNQSIVQLEPLLTLIHQIHNDNNPIKEMLILGTFFNVNNLKYLNQINFIPDSYYYQYKSIFINDEYVNYDIVYLTGGTGITWDPSDQSLGGSEQAIVNLSEEWVKQGKSVAVYGKFNKNEMFKHNNVVYYNWLDFPFEKKFKTLISWRTPGMFMLINNIVKADNLWQDFHDNFIYTLNNFKPDKLKEYFNRVNCIYFKSNYHKICFEDFLQTKLDENKYKIIPNGLRLLKFLNNEVDKKLIEREKYRFCYCSCYTRGLENILKYIWPKIYKAEPSVELHIYYGMKLVDDEFKNMMNELMKQPGVYDHGRQPMAKIIEEKYKSTFHLYLNNSIAEIDCISIRESLVTGCIPVISSFGVFGERDGMQYNYNENSQNYIEQLDKISDDIISKMKNKVYTDTASKQLKKSKTIIDWYFVAKAWLN